MAQEKVVLEITGMTCDGCAQTIKRQLKQERGVSEAAVDSRSGFAEVLYDPDVTDEEAILKSPSFQRQYKAQVVGPACC